jgi:hypothetical protein
MVFYHKLMRVDDSTFYLQSVCGHIQTTLFIARRKLEKHGLKKYTDFTEEKLLLIIDSMGVVS